MDEYGAEGRVYGSRYYETRTIVELDVLAERILADLPSLIDMAAVPPTIDFGIHLIANVLLRLNVGGLPDEFTFTDRICERYSRAAVQLASRLMEIMESYNWTNPDELPDRRFFCSVHLLSEAGYRSAFWTPGVVRLL